MLTCNECGTELKWEDTTDVEGGILEGYIREQQIWERPKCGKVYCVSTSISFSQKDIKIEEVLEN